jgi:hypothetical protein
MGTQTGLSAQEYAAIHNLYAYYNLCSDMGAPEEYASCFTPDGVLLVQGLVLSGDGFVRGPGGIRVSGRQELTAFKQKDQAGRAGRYRRHWNGSIFLEKVDDATVRGRCYLQAYNGDPGSLPVLAQTGVYEDLIVKADGQWMFASRTLTID